MQRTAGFAGWIGLVAGPMVHSDVPKGRSSMATWGIGLAGLVCRLIKIVIPSEAQDRPGIHALLKEAGFRPLRE
ncbi:hypothetical protein TH5_04980 [Thalassospira xianhensis MCCC 1A02616]|uniref:Uncharacterized protein n=1 Tax=Thalassospira xianhensis MCCC 1A02616 TaxID=1177929 RepID=A0A367UIF2_9PROT|nr:hypothetical protein TH5_04980 [Thalassospira xianhensis MCCC 1A02616]